MLFFFASSPQLSGEVKKNTSASLELLQEKPYLDARVHAHINNNVGTIVGEYLRERESNQIIRMTKKIAILFCRVVIIYSLRGMGITLLRLF